MWSMSAVASGVMFITGDGQNVPQYSSCDNITAAFFPLAYSDSIHWLAAAASTHVYGMKGWKY